MEAGEATAVEIFEAFFEHQQAVEPKVRAFNSADHQRARSMAKASDERRAAGKSLGPLDGIPVGIKDVIAEAGQPLTCSSRMLASYTSVYDAHVTERLKNAGAVLWGRLNLDEFAMGSSTENSATQVTANPWDLACVLGGSSGGCAAAVAAAQLPLSVGSDTGGSIRQPAAFCGVTGLKPTYGSVSRYGLVAFASSLDQIGPFARTAEDTALLLDALVGHDARDSTSCAVPEPGTHNQLLASKGPWTIGVPKEYFTGGIEPEVLEKVEAAMQWYADFGCTLREVSLPTTDLAIPVYYLIAPAEASSNLARFDGVRYGHRSTEATDILSLYCKSRAEGFGAEVKRRIILGTYALSSGYYDAYYRKAQQVRTLIRRDFARVFEGVDALLTPTTPTVAFKAGAKSEDPLSMYLNDIFTINVNLAGLPALSQPCGFTKAGMPVGYQLIGKAFAEATLLQMAHQYELAHPFAEQLPPLAQ
jgi:aspartyl-tRNA(Asn)/glutamyl-tRNA(Gln) amidotransferase subunit A